MSEQIDRAHEAQRWLEWLYGPQPDGLIWIGGHGDRFAGRTFTSIADAVTYAEQLDQGGAGGVYHRLTTLRPIGQGRGTAADSAYLPGFAMDLDLRGPGHKALNYPETEQELVTLLRKAGLPEPSAWVHSGGGRYPFWKLDQPADLTLPHELERAAEISARLHKLVIGWAGDAGWKVDNTSDLARVYRLPGTHNRKGDEPVVAHVLWDRADASSTYSLDGMHTAVWTAPRPAGSAPERTSELDPFSTASQLFSGNVAEVPRVYSVSEAMAYVQPALEALRTAQDGEINNRLNDAAMMMAHFGEEFWSREAAERQLLAALAETVYDGGTWQAEVTISSAYNAIATKSGADYWRAVLRPELAPSAIPEDRGELSREQWLEQQLVSASDLAARPAPVPLVYGLLNMDTESWLIGEPGSFKSFVALDLAAHVGAGREWQGHRVRQERVLYLAAEGVAGMTLRTRAWQLRSGQMEGVDFLPLPLQVSKIDDWQALVSIAGRRGYGFVVIDTQARVTKGLDENTAKDSGVFIDAVTALRMATKGCILTVHHTGRDGKNARGSSAIDGAQDTELKLERINPRRDLKVKLREDKQKDQAEDESGLIMKLDVVELGTDPVTEARLSSLVVLGQDAWRNASGAGPAMDSGQVLTIREPEQWTWALVGHNRKDTERRILQTFADLYAGGQGRTEAQVQQAVRDRWFEGKPLKAGRSGHLAEATWAKAWSLVTGLTGRDGEQVLTNGQQRWSLNLAAVPDGVVTDE